MNFYQQPYLAYLKEEKNLSDSTLDAYERDLAALIRYLREQGAEEPASVTRQQLTRYTAELKGKGRKGSTMSRHIASLKAYFRYLTRAGYVDRDPSLDLIPPPQETRMPKVSSA